jgi:4'-phosphopantetheinyl transferase EntD
MLFRPLLPETVLLAEMPPAQADPALLHAEELQRIERAVDKRRREFAAGRLLAHGLLEAVGAPRSPLLPDANRVPAWPTGVVGSITHCPNLCAVAIAPASQWSAIGLDVETAAPMDEALLPMILRDAERARIAALPDAIRPFGGILVFSIKEAVYKAIYPQCRVFLDFQQVELAFEGEDGFVAEVLVAGAHPPGYARIRGRFRVADGHVASVVVLPR